MNNLISAEDLRAEVARKQIPLYKLAASIDIHPGRLGMMLCGTMPLPADIAERVLGALKSEEPKVAA